MAIANKGKPFTDYLSDPFGENVLNKLKGEDCSFITGGVLDNTIPNPNNVWTDKFVDLPSRTDLMIPEGGRVHMGDFSMSSKEFKICMKMLHKMAMEEMPEEFI